MHVEGTLEPTQIQLIAERNGLAMPYGSVHALRARYAFQDLQSFLNLYYANMAVLRTEQDFHDLTAAYLRRARTAGVQHAEIFVDPQAHTARGVPTSTVLAGMRSAIRAAMTELGMTASIIPCVLRDQSPDAAMRMLAEVLEASELVVAIGLDSAEVGNPPNRFTAVFAAARDAGLHVVAHAGEEGPPEFIWEALDVLGAERIDHGVACLQDAALVRRLAADAIPLTVCPTSNVRLHVVDDPRDVPVRRMLDLGLSVTINSDDPAYFGGYLDDNVELCRDFLGCDDREIRQLALNSRTGSFSIPA